MQVARERRPVCPAAGTEGAMNHVPVMPDLPSIDNLPTQYHHAEPQRRWYAFWEERGYFHSEPDPRSRAVHDRHSAAQRHRGAAPGARAQQHAARHPHPLQADAGLQRPVDAGHRPRRHRHAGRRRAAAVAKKKRKRRHDLGREELVERIWEWKNEYESPHPRPAQAHGL